MACNDLKRWGGTCRAHNERYRNGFTVFPIPFEYREFLGRESGSLPTKFDHLSSLQRERENNPPWPALLQLFDNGSREFRD